MAFTHVRAAAVPLTVLALLAAGCGTAAPERPQDVCGVAAPTLAPTADGAHSPRAGGGGGSVDGDGDGFDDLVVTRPGHFDDEEDPENPVAHDGSLLIVPGSEDGPDDGAAQSVVPGEDGVPASPQDDVRFGDTALSGDFDADGATDIAVSAGPETEEDDDQGAIVLVWGGEGGVDGGTVVQDSGDVQPWLTAVGDFDGDGASDMLVGVEWFGDESEVLYGPFDRDGAPARTVSSGVDLEGLDHSFIVGDTDGDGCDDLVAFRSFEEMAHETALWTGGEDGFEPAGTRANADEGVVADVDGDGYGDLVVREVGTTVEDGASGPGAVTVYPGGPDGPAAEPASRVGMDETGLPQNGVDGDELGTVLEAGDVDGDGYADVAAAVNRPSGGEEPPVDEGDVVVLPGGPDGLTGEGARLLRPEEADQYPQVSPPPDDVYWDTYEEVPRTLLRLVDTDGDGADDVVAGRPSSVKGTVDAPAGPVRVYRGLQMQDGSLIPGDVRGIDLPEGDGRQGLAG